MAFVDDYTALISSNTTWNHITGRAIAPKAVFLTYSFAQTAAPYSDGILYEDPDFFRPLSAQEKTIFRTAIDAWSAVSGITFFEVAAGYGDIEAGAYDLLNDKANGQGSMPTSGVYWRDGEARLYAPGNGAYKGIWFDHQNGMNLRTMLHEIGHTLGMEHPHDGTDPFLSAEMDVATNTVMSRNGNRVPNLGPLDIDAIQALYGTPSQKGSNVVSWSWNPATSTLTQVGSGGPDILHGTATHDIIYGGGSRDLIVAKGGNDTIFVQGKAFQVAAGPGFDTVHSDMVRSDIRTVSKNGDTVQILTKGATSWDITMFETERVMFRDAALAFDFEGIAGQAYRLYRAAFARTPDEGGLGFWIRKLDAGEGDLLWAARGFMGSAEFASKYGQPSAVSNEAFVGVLYRNVLERNADSGGYAYWNSQISNGMTRDQILRHFSESAENKANVADIISNGIWFT